MQQKNLNMVAKIFALNHSLHTLLPRIPLYQLEIFGDLKGSKIKTKKQQ